jgi:hypothetical protein
MIEFTTLTIITLILIAILRPGKTPPLSNPLVIERPGQYHMTLAPQLNLAQPFIEAIAKQLTSDNTPRSESSIQCFEIQDKDVAAHGHDRYLLAITQRNDLLYFQAIAPQSLIHDKASPYASIKDFAEKVLANIPAHASPHDIMDQRINTAVQSIAQQRKIIAKEMAADIDSD